MHRSTYITKTEFANKTNLANDLFLLMANLTQLESHDRIILLFTNAINSLFPEIRFDFELNEKQDDIDFIEICTKNKSFGRIKIYGLNEKISSLKLDLIYNSVQMLAIILERIEQKEILKNEKSLLNELVKEKTAELEKNQAMFKTLAENSPDAIYRMNRKHEYIYLNNNFKLLFDINKDNFIGKTFKEIGLSETMCVNLEKELEKLYKYGIPVTTVIKHPDTSKYIEHRLVPEFKNNKIISALGLARDISEIKETQDKLIKAKEKAEESDRLKTAFLSNISNEISLPLNGIMGFSKLLGKVNLSDEKRLNYINIIETNINNLVHTITNILSISKIDSGIDNVLFQPVKVNGLLKNLYELFLYEKKIINKDHVDSELITPKKEIIINTDDYLLRQVLINLLENALKFTFEGEIKIGYKLTGDEIIFFVKDTGRGIKKENLKNVFEKFFKEDVPGQEKNSGMGLGLTISGKIIEKLGGKIWIKSTLHKGTSVYFSIPLFN